MLSIGSHTQKPPHPNIELAHIPPSIIAVMFVFAVNIVAHFAAFSVLSYCVNSSILFIIEASIIPIKSIGGCIADI